MTLPAAQMHLKDVEAALHVRGLGALGHPTLVAPTIPCDVKGARRGTRDELGVERVRVGLEQQVALLRLDDVLVELALGHALDEALPDAACRTAAQCIGRVVPVVEVANHVHALDAGGPDRKVVALGAA